MKILWITNIILPDACRELNIPSPVYGGWVYSLARNLIYRGDINLAIVSLYSGKIYMDFTVNGIRYFLIPSVGSQYRYQSDYEQTFKKIKESFLPEVIHIHGTEFPFGLSYVKSCGTKNVVCSIQGLIGVYHRYYYSGITVKEITKHISIRDLIKNDTIFRQKNKFKLRGNLELQYLQSDISFIGRTLWDRYHIASINQNAEYYFCNETLRSSFYSRKWELDNCTKYSIFISQANYPIKGLHFMIKALPIIRHKFPSVHIYIAGENIFSEKSLKKRIFRTGYANYINCLIRSLEVQDHVEFVGQLTEEQMLERYLNSHIFVCPSSIENSPNSVGEAQILGVPCVASYVGGVPDLITHNESGLLYNYEEYEMLACLIVELFSNDELATEISVNARAIAFERHSIEKNITDLSKIYETIANKGNIKE